MRGGINNRHRMVRIANSTQPTVMNVNETNLEKLVNPQKCSITAEIIALASGLFPKNMHFFGVEFASFDFYCFKFDFNACNRKSFFLSNVFSMLPINIFLK